jgi:hypothetical protein
MNELRLGGTAFGGTCRELDLPRFRQLLRPVAATPRTPIPGHGPRPGGTPDPAAGLDLCATASPSRVTLSSTTASPAASDLDRRATGSPPAADVEAPPPVPPAAYPRAATASTTTVSARIDCLPG